MKKLPLLALSLLILAAMSPAQTTNPSEVHSREIWVFGGGNFISNTALGTDQLTGGSATDLQLKGGALFGVRADFNQGDHIGHEVQYINGRTPIQYNYDGGFKLGGSVNRFGYNFLGYINKKESRARFFATVGAQLSNFSRPSNSEIGCEGQNCTEAGQPPTTSGNNKFGLNYGAGAKIRLTSRFGLRFDVRQYVNGKPFNLPLASGLLQQTEISGGFGVTF